VAADAGTASRCFSIAFGPARLHSALGTASAMNHLGLYFACVLATLLAFSVGLLLVARATKWKPKPIKPLRAVLIVFAAVFVAGSVCGIAGRDIHILYWWLLGAPLVGVFIPLVVVATNLFVRLIMGALFSAAARFQRRR
jgi:hypothetical protein